MTDNESAAMVEKVISSGGDAGPSPDEPSPPTKKPDEEDDPPPIAEEEEDTSKPPADEDAATDKTTDDAAKTSISDIAKEDDSTDDDDDDDDDKNNDPPSSDASPDDLLLRAMTHKEEGNTHFKSGDYTSATRSYRKGTNLLKKLNEANSGDEQVKVLLISLQTNLSMVCYRQKKHRMSRDVASRALEIDPLNVKALYRRAVASRAMGDADAAKDDLKAALKVDPKNVSAKKELMAIKKTLEEQKKKEKAGLQKAFSKKGSSLLYSDKEEEEKRKLKEKKEKKILEAEAKQKRKKEWEDESVKMMYRDPPETPISFDDWEKQRKQKEEEKEKARKKAKKEEERKRKDQQHKTAAANSNNNTNNDSDDDELTEKELAMLRGYKKTSDGRTTSYFNNEQTEHTKKLIGDFTPKRMETPSSPSPTASISSGGGGSAWNQSGTTWEEKDTTDWCKKTLEQCLLDTTTAYYSTSSNDSTYVAVVKKVSDLTGDASVALVGGKKRYIYDFHASVEYEVLDDAQACIASGILKLPELNSATTAEEDELEVEVLGWKKVPAGGEGAQGVLRQDAVECRTMLVQDVRKSVLRFVEKFNADF